MPARSSASDVARIPLARRVHTGEVAEVGDPAVTGGHEMADRLLRPTPVVADDGVHVEELGRAVDEHDRHAGLLLSEQVAVIVARRHDDEAVDAPAGERGYEEPLADRVLVDAAREHLDPACPGNVPDRPVEGGRERVRDVLEDQADRRAPTARATEAAGGEVGEVVELLDRPHHAAAQLGRHPRLPVDHARDRLEADAGQARRHPASSAARRRRCRRKITLSSSP